MWKSFLRYVRSIKTIRGKYVMIDRDLFRGADQRRRLSIPRSLYFPGLPPPRPSRKSNKPFLFPAYALCYTDVKNHFYVSQLIKV